MKRNQNTIKLAVVNDLTGFHGAAGCSKTVSCDHAKLGEVRLATTLDPLDCNVGTAQPGEELPMEYYGSRGSVVCVEIQEPTLGKMHILKSSYDSNIATCQACCNP